MAISMRMNGSNGVRTTRPPRATVVPCAAKASFAQTTAAVLAATAMLAGSASALTYDELQGLTYKQVKGTGVANTCPSIEGGFSTLKDLKSGSYAVQNFCMEPSSFAIKGESSVKGGSSEFLPTKLVTRLTYTLAAMDGELNVGDDKVTFKEIDGMDYAAVTVSMPGGERVPFLFTIKQFEGAGTLDSFSGDFTVPAYRGSTFMDPKGRGGSTGYDNALALPSRADDDEFRAENDKKATVMKGSAVFSVAKVDVATGEISGVFVSLQPSDDDMGAKAPKDVKVTGNWYAQLV
ncbi:hypothetical protein FOA52_000200 [Chlamydomonas sp. UWO 241]|nr:hypothetical protein FOA52_000198 [Chlamydomonas sp. UWO 241]KAG1671822.1 hypothetical protein FOA52_000199 [Chlamydomonas sp. UWO 241]KAG1671823.1 hypothetical protein FOA52_000200 [Chlamydomonas sp. UWO 241]